MSEQEDKHAEVLAMLERLHTTHLYETCDENTWVRTVTSGSRTGSVCTEVPTGNVTVTITMRKREDGDAEG